MDLQMAASPYRYNQLQVNQLNQLNHHHPAAAGHTHPHAHAAMPMVDYFHSCKSKCWEIKRLFPRKGAAVFLNFVFIFATLSRIGLPPLRKKLHVRWVDLFLDRITFFPRQFLRFPFLMGLILDCESKRCKLEFESRLMSSSFALLSLLSNVTEFSFFFFFNFLERKIHLKIFWQRWKREVVLWLVHKLLFCVADLIQKKPVKHLHLFTLAIKSLKETYWRWTGWIDKPEKGPEKVIYPKITHFSVFDFDHFFAMAFFFFSLLCCSCISACWVLVFKFS